jgi:hypothetical protein
VLHHEEWFPFFGYSNLFDIYKGKLEIAEFHLEPDPFIVPPVLAKTALVEEPILKTIWAFALAILNKADKIFFVGYSLPTTDIAAATLFREGIRRDAVSRIKVVTRASTRSKKQLVFEAYERVFPKIKRSQFEFRDALDWSREVTSASI